MHEYRSYKYQKLRRHFKDVRLDKLFKARSACHLLSHTQCLVQCRAYRDTKHMDERATKQTGGLEELGFSPIF